MKTVQHLPNSVPSYDVQNSFPTRPSLDSVSRMEWWRWWRRLIRCGRSLLLEAQITQLAVIWLPALGCARTEGNSQDSALWNEAVCVVRIISIEMAIAAGLPVSRLKVCKRGLRGLEGSFDNDWAISLRSTTRSLSLIWGFFISWEGQRKGKLAYAEIRQFVYTAEDLEKAENMEFERHTFR